jgi:hypothetical protein
MGAPSFVPCSPPLSLPRDGWDCASAAEGCVWPCRMNEGESSCSRVVTTCRPVSAAVPGASDWLNDVRSAMDMSDKFVWCFVCVRACHCRSSPSSPVHSVVTTCATPQITRGPLVASSCDAEASSSGLTASKMALLGTPLEPLPCARHSEVRGFFISLFCWKSLALTPSIRYDVAGIPTKTIDTFTF